MSKTKSIAVFLILSQSAVGLFVVLLAKQIPNPSWLSSSILLLLLFILLNVVIAYQFKITDELKRYWSIKKSYYLVIGALGGLLIAFFPTFVGLAIGNLNMEQFNLNQGITFRAVGLTLVIVSWEELWFRGIILNYCKNSISVITISITVGVLFMLMHLLNPTIDILHAALPLFFAGTFLTLLYFHYKNIWLPIGLHFGNNIYSNLFGTAFKNDLVYGNDGYLSTLLLAILTTFLLWKMRRNSIRNSYR